MAWGECFTRRAVACEFFVFADFANSSRRRLLRPAVGFMETPSLAPSQAAPTRRQCAASQRRCNAPCEVGRERGSVRNCVYALMVAPTVIYMLILVASLAASVRSLRQRPFLPRDETPMFAIWRLGDDPFNRCRVNAAKPLQATYGSRMRVEHLPGGFVVEILREPSK